MRILLWHVHGGWTDAFVRGTHDYFLPTTADRGPWGLGTGGRAWPDSVHEIAPKDLADADIDLVVLQRPAEIAKSQRLLGRRLGREVPAVYVEHNTPRGDVPNAVHPLAERSDILIVHVTHFNRLVWDCGRARTTVIEHGVADPGLRYTGKERSFGVVINEPVRRWRITGTDLLPAFAEVAPLSVYGMGTEGLPEALGLSPASIMVRGDLPTQRLHVDLSRCRVYLHPLRWTSLGLALIEAMQLGMPVLALATTEASRAVPAQAGAISADPDELLAAGRSLMHDPAEAAARGRFARQFALDHYGLPAFLTNWDAVIGDQISRMRAAHTRQLASLNATEG